MRTLNLCLTLGLGITASLPISAEPSLTALRARDQSGTAIVRETQPHWDRVFGPPPVRAGAVGAPTVEVRRNFVYIEDTDGTLRIPYQTNQDVQDSFDFALNQFYQALPDEFVFLYLFTSFETGVGAFFYSPQANTDTGIGQPRFDNTGPSPLEGFVFMNDWQSFNKDFGMFGQVVVDGFSRSVFNQEAGHRWGFQLDFPQAPDARLQPLLGRDDAHWSYFAHTGGSPMEGNAWRDNMNGTFTTITDVRNYQYCDVDLYLMGLIPVDQVRPWFLVGNPQVNGLRDIFQQPLSAASPPQIFQPATIRGTRVDYTVEDLASRLGERFPHAGQAPNRFRVAFLILASRATALTAGQKVEFERMVDGYAEGFHTGTRQLASFDYVLDATPKLPIGSECGAPDQCDPSAPICEGTAAGGPSICTKVCNTPASCPNGWCCGPGAAMGDNICQPAGQCTVQPQPDAGPPDTGEVVDGGISESDGGSLGADVNPGADAQEACVCDLTTACDPSCACDPECQDAGRTTPPPARSGGCSCEGTSPSDLAGLSLAGLALLLVRRRARR